MSIQILIGTQWGDEGKGKIIDLLSEKKDVVARCQGGANAGHTLVTNDKKFVLHLVPSGILYPETLCVMGNGMVIDPTALLEEITMLDSENISVANRLFISDRAHLIMPYHKVLDTASEGRKTNLIGTTGRGIGPAYIDKANRTGLRMGDLLNENTFKEKLSQNIKTVNNVLDKVYNLDKLDEKEITHESLEVSKQIKQYIVNTSDYLNQAIKEGKNILIEGAQGNLLDLDHGTYPFVTSSNSTAGGACTGLGVGPTHISSVLGVIKAYTTRVGEGPFPTELLDETGEKIRKLGSEFGATTGRPRRCGWFDVVLAKYAAQVNGISELALTKLDVLDNFEEIKICVGYKYNNDTITSFPADIEILKKCEPIYKTFTGWQQSTSNIRDYNDLPANTKTYIEAVSKLIDTKFSIISVGPDRKQTLFTKE
jgi:adenylosuccinate synthase